MKGWLESVVGPDYAAALMWTIVALIVLLVLLVSIRIVRGFSTGTFIAGGRNRKTRLAVMDATAVDSHRRLVLVRRDDVEHLILIGGPTDVVVEQNIRLIQATRRPAEELAYHHGHVADMPPVAEQPRPQHHHAEPAPRPAPPPAPPPPQRPAAAPATAPAAPPPAAPARTEPRFSQHLPSSPPRPAAPVPAAPVAPAPAASGAQPARPVMAPVQVTSPTPPAPAVAAPVKPAKPDLDDELLKELEVSLDKEQMAAAPQPAVQPATKSAADSTLDEEMSRLLSDLAGKR